MTENHIEDEPMDISLDSGVNETNNEMDNAFLYKSEEYLHLSKSFENLRIFDNSNFTENWHSLIISSAPNNATTVITPKVFITTPSDDQDTSYNEGSFEESDHEEQVKKVIRYTPLQSMHNSHITFSPIYEQDEHVNLEVVNRGNQLDHALAFEKLINVTPIKSVHNTHMIFSPIYREEHEDLEIPRVVIQKPTPKKPENKWKAPTKKRIISLISAYRKGQAQIKGKQYVFKNFY